MLRFLVNLGFLAPLAVWTGAAAGLTFLTTPQLFAALDRDSAGRVVGALFPAYFRLGILSVAVALAASLVGVGTMPGRRGRLWAIPALLGALLLLMLYSGLVLEPQVAAVQARIPSFVTDTDSPARQEFRQLHAQSSILNLLGLGLVAAVWVLTALDPRLLTGGERARRPAPGAVGAGRGAAEAGARR